jgi:RNA polymerase subunit RPABC4/transcription elongation factor Spt4
MSKPHRGRSIRELFARGRGECPVCNRNNVKVLYEQEAGGQKFKICKTCKAAIKNGKKKLPVVIAETAPVPAEEPKAAPVETPEKETVPVESTEEV